MNPRLHQSNSSLLIKIKLTNMFSSAVPGLESPHTLAAAHGGVFKMLCFNVPPIKSNVSPVIS